MSKKPINDFVKRNDVHAHEKTHLDTQHMYKNQEKAYQIS